MICAILIPSRSRPERLLKTLKSIFETVADKNNIEVLLRFDDDDKETLSRIEEFRNDRTRTFIGKRGEGWSGLNTFYTEMAAYTEAKWLWIMNDDAYITGYGWDEILKEIPTTGFLVQPELYQLGFSKYYDVEGGAFPVIPHHSWEPHWEGFIDPIDIRIDELLRIQLGWKSHFLKGIGVIHERDDDEALAEHRKL